MGDRGTPDASKDHLREPAGADGHNYRLVAGLPIRVEKWLAMPKATLALMLLLTLGAGPAFAQADARRGLTQREAIEVCGLALVEASKLETETARLAEAARAYRLSLQEISREHTPVSRSMARIDMPSHSIPRIWARALVSSLFMAPILGTMLYRLSIKFSYV